MSSVKSDGDGMSSSLKRRTQGPAGESTALINDQEDISCQSRNSEPRDDSNHLHDVSTSLMSLEELASEVYGLKRALFALQDHQGSPKERFCLGRRSFHTADQIGSARSENFSLSERDHVRAGAFPSSEDGDKGWTLKIKRWKRVNNRYGSSDLYDESQKIEDIRSKEQEIRSGGYVLSV